MPQAEDKYFDCLKGDISKKLREKHPGVDADVSKWKGEDIVKFQEDLIRTVSGRISEKWFYMHIKTGNGHLPRIDILNLLSRYAGYEDWSSYKGSKTETGTDSVQKPRYTRYFLPLTILAVIALMIYYLFPVDSKTYSFCFINALNKEPLVKGEIEIIVLNDSESPYRIVPGQHGCVDFTVQQNEVRFVIKGAYYKSDTIFRRLNKLQSQEVIAVRVNDYALMLHLFSKGNIDDWEARRAKLNHMFADDAQIFQIMEGQMIGMEMYNKDEFINKLTMPLTSLKNIEIIETVYHGERIKELRFKQEHR